METNEKRIAKLRETADCPGYAPPHDWRSCRLECMIECAKKEIKELEEDENGSTQIS